MKSRSIRLRKGQFWTLNVFASLALVLVLLNTYLSMSNRAMQIEVNNRQQFINQSIQLSRFNNQLIRTLASLSAQTDDKEIEQLLAAHGITFSVNSPGSPSVAGSSN